MPTFYVDIPRNYPPQAIRSAQARRCGTRWCHLWTDGTPEDLHQFAARIGMKRAWFQDREGFPHYDLVPSRRDHAIRLGAVEKPLAEWRREQQPLVCAIEQIIPHSVLAKFAPPDDQPMRPPRPAMENREIRFGGGRMAGRTHVERTMQQMQHTLDLFAPKPEPLPGRLQPLLLFASRFVERHARRGEIEATGTLALNGREQHLDEELRPRLEAAVLDVMNKTLSRCEIAPDRDYVCSATYTPGRNEISVWGIEVKLCNQQPR